jgi:hypothetical protein
MEEHKHNRNNELFVWGNTKFEYGRKKIVGYIIGAKW